MLFNIEIKSCNNDHNVKDSRKRYLSYIYIKVKESKEEKEGKKGRKLADEYA